MDRRDFLVPAKKKPTIPDLSGFEIARTNSGLAPYGGVFGTNEIIHLLKRTMFGAVKADVDYFKTKTLSQAVNELLTVPVVPPFMFTISGLSSNLFITAKACEAKASFNSTRSI